LVGMAVASFLIWNATYMGKQFEEYTESGYIVGEDNNTETKNLEMAMAQNEKDDTSCALPEEEEEEEDGDDEAEGEEDVDEEEGGDARHFVKKPTAEVTMV
jgi:AAA family ATP:ADP antiporter